MMATSALWPAVLVSCFATCGSVDVSSIENAYKFSWPAALPTTTSVLESGVTTTRLTSSPVCTKLTRSRMSAKSIAVCFGAADGAGDATPWGLGEELGGGVGTVRDGNSGRVGSSAG